MQSSVESTAQHAKNLHAWINATKIQVVAVLLIPVLFVVYRYNVTPSSIRQPWSLSGDILSAYSFSQSSFHGFLGFSSPIYGAPKFLDYRYDTFDFLNAALLVTLRSISDNPFLAVNLFYLLTFPLSAATFYLVARALRIDSWIGAALAIVYALLPYHFYRFHQGHVSLAGYYLLPLGVLSILRVCELITPSGSPTHNELRKVIGYFLINVLVGSSVAYYALFLSCLSVLIQLVYVIKFRQLQIKTALFMFISTVGFVVVPASMHLLAPSQRFPISRQADGSLDFGGSITSLLVPWSRMIPDNLLDALSPAPRQLEWVGLSIISFVGILSMFLTTKRSPKIFAVQLTCLTTIILISVLFYLKGGLGYIFARYVNADFRAWNRFSIIIETAALLGLGLVISTRSRTLRMRLLLLGTLAFACSFGTLSKLQAIGVESPPSSSTQSLIDDLEAFSVTLHNHLDEGCSILVLPTLLYPEGGIVNDVYSGDHFRLGLFNPQFHWSYGASKFSEDGRFWENAYNPNLGEGVGEEVGRFWENAYNPNLVEGASEIRLAKQLGFCAVVFDSRADLGQSKMDGAVFPDGSELYDLVLFTNESL